MNIDLTDKLKQFCRLKSKEADMMWNEALYTLTYVVGSLRMFNQWRAANGIDRRQLRSVRHIRNERDTLGLLRPRADHRVVVLPDADGEALRRLSRRGFNVD